MKQLLLTVLFTWWIAPLYAQPLLMPVGKNTGSGSYSRHFQQVVSAWYNPAGLSCLSSFAAGIYTENRFMLKEASLYAAMVAIPVRAGAFGGSITRLGNAAWHQQRLSGAYGMQLGRRAGIGLQFNYETTSVQGLGATGNISFDGGMLWHISEQWHGGLHVYKPADAPVMYSGGLGFEASRDFLLTGEVVSMGAFTAVKASAYYRVIRQLALEMGIASGQAYNSAAVILFLRSLRIDIAAGFHPQLGITPVTSLIWQLSPPPVME
ncbi:hypothetical protein AB6805_24860 [Chitinophaga sp. RCC_12]|uniref:hypothetical protein n=1 Tax=Chitinophaga sp. RCC_12 TaxID=3239226 RepID=UPI00352606C4